MRQRGSMHAPAWAPAIGIAERADGARHRPHHRSGLSAEQQQILELQRLAGNAAVTQALSTNRSAGQVTSIDRMELNREGMAPEKGVQQIREKTTNKLTLALTQRSIVDAPPLFRAESPKQDKGGYTTQARKVGSMPEPEIHEFWPKQGLHKMLDGSFLDVSQKWEEDLQKGEDQHRDDAVLAWKITWKAVQSAINKLAEKPGPPAPTGEEAVRALWKRYKASLDEELRPKGDLPTDAAQLDLLAVRPKTYFAHCWETTIVRDSRDYHTATPGALPPEGAAHAAPKDAMVLGVVGGSKFDVKGPEPEILSNQLREKWRAEPGRVVMNSALK